MPCSRMPKCSVRPPMRPGSTESASAFSLLASGAPAIASSPLIVVLVEGARSAEPPMNSGIAAASAAMQAPELDARRLRVGAREVGQRVLPALGQLAREHAVELVRPCAGSLRAAGVHGVPGACSAAPRSRWEKCA